MFSDLIKVPTMDIVDFKCLVNDILHNFVTVYEVANLAKRFNVDISSKDFSQQKRTVLREILIHILRDELPDPKYRQLLSETEHWLTRRKDSGFSCSYVGCFFRGRVHKMYMKHLNNVHFADNNLLCNFNKRCKERFPDLGALREHVDSRHLGNKNSRNSTGNNEYGIPADLQARSSNSLSLGQPCQCNLTSCGGKKFPNLKKLMVHYSNVHNLERRMCIFKDCNKEFSPQFSSRMHFYRHHSSPNTKILKEEFLIVTTPSISTNSFDDINPGREDETSVTADDLDIYLSEEEDLQNEHSAVEQDSLENVTKKYADFLNRLAFHHMVAQTTIDIVVKEYLSLITKTNEIKKKLVKEVLLGENVSNSTINRIMAIFDNDESIIALEQLNSAFKRESFLLNNFKMVPPTEIVLNQEEVKKGAKKESYQYISILESMAIFIQDPTVIELLEEVGNTEVNSREIIYKDVKDGTLYKDLPYFKENPDALVGLIYSDGIEVVNPLGAGKGRSKLVELYWTIADIPKEYRSKVDSINLGIVVQEKLLKKYGYARIYKPLIEDMLKLERGIEISSPFKRKLKVGFMLHIGDNLESNSLGGFSTCFSSGDICRICHVTYDQLDTKIHDYTQYGPNSYWTVDEYDKIVDQIIVSKSCDYEVLVGNLEDHLFDEVEEPGHILRLSDSESDDDNDDSSDEGRENEVAATYGLRARCPFTDLASFHPTYSFPTDFLHDFCEGRLSGCMLLKIYYRIPHFIYKKVSFWLGLLYLGCVRYYVVCFTLGRALVYCNILKEVRLGGWSTEGPKAPTSGRHVSACATILRLRASH